MLFLIEFSFVFSLFSVNFTVLRGANFHETKVLVFGGNGFIGSETVIELLKKHIKVTNVNRGHQHWDSEDRITPYVENIKCDRMITLKNCEQFVSLIHRGGERIFFDAVIDFSGYHPFAVRDAMSVMGRRFGLYIYISTDSVYDISVGKTHLGPSAENDAVVSLNIEEVNDDNYANLKFQCEEVLKQALSLGGPPYIVLRLPDVIGPRDTTNRWWIYQLWLKLSPYLDKQLSIPHHLANKSMSLVYVSDVAKVITQLVFSNANLHNQAYNLAFKETITLPQLLNEIVNFLDIKRNIPLNTSDDTTYLYPSVKMGPIDISKAVEYLNWTPTPLKHAIQKTIQFYEDVMRDAYFYHQRSTIIHLLTGHLSNDKRGLQIAKGVYHEYGVNLFKHPDEL